jgi:serine O-acetyltransferase
MMLWKLLQEDVQTVFAKDPAARTWWEVITCYPGLHAIWSHRVAHILWGWKLRWLARFLSHLSRWLTGIEIHPAATIGRRFFIDHGMGIVVGETSEIGDDVLVYKGVVLGGTSLNKGKRHPTIEDGVIIGSNAVVLGPITIGINAKIGSGAVVIRPVPAESTAVGVPARVVRGPHVEMQRSSFDFQHAQLPDPIAELCRQMDARIRELEREVYVLTQDLSTVLEERRVPATTFESES